MNVKDKVRWLGDELGDKIRRVKLEKLAISGSYGNRRKLVQK